MDVHVFHRLCECFLQGSFMKQINDPFKLRPQLIHKGSVKNDLVEFTLEFAVDLINLIEQNRRNSELFRGFLRLKIG